MDKAEVVFEKIALSPGLIERAFLKAKKLKGVAEKEMDSLAKARAQTSFHTVKVWDNFYKRNKQVNLFKNS